MTNEQILKQAVELLPKVTRGNWCVKDMSRRLGFAIETVNACIAETGIWADEFRLENKANAQLIALSPQLARIALEQAEQIKTLREALGDANRELHRLDEDMPTRHYVVGNIIKQALAATAEKE